MTPARIEVDRSQCMGSGTCVYLAPHRFALVDGIAQVVGDPADLDADVREAVEGCPAEALSLTEDQ